MFRSPLNAAKARPCCAASTRWWISVRKHAHDLDLVRFVLFGDDTYEAFAAAASG